MIQLGEPTYAGLTLCLLLTMAGLSCSSDDGQTPTGPSVGAASLSGHWSGAVASATSRGVLELVVEERPVDGARSLLTGTWSVRYDDGSGVSGNVSGTRLNGTATLDLVPAPRPECSPGVAPYALLAGGFTLRVTATASRLAGSSDAYSCSGMSTSPVDLSR